jgi:[ribosomal protein S5]-alanine N-acetyltransferase
VPANDPFAEFPLLRTDRLLLRETRTSDARAIFRVFSDAAVTRYHNQSTFTRIEEARAVVRSRAALFRHGWGIRWAIARKEDDLLIGACGFHNWHRACSHAEIGYELASDWWRRGLMTEALGAMLAFGFDRMDLNRIEALVMPDNVASARLLRKLGFTAEGTLRQYGHWKERFHDLTMFSLLREEHLRSTGVTLPGSGAG